jgi:hypothetical protein
MNSFRILIQAAFTLGCIVLLAVFVVGGCGRRPAANPAQAACGDDNDCTTPGPCESAEGAACVDGFCQFQPKVCDAPPVADCSEDDNTYRTYSAPGSCGEDGECQYAAHEYACPGCKNNCLGACDGIVCDDTTSSCRTGHCEPGPPAHCVYETATDNTACTDGNGCTTGDRCMAGVCTPTGNKTCGGGDPCHDAGSCNPSTGNCSSPTNKPDNTSCNDGNACTTNDRCRNGTCAGDTGCSDNNPCTYGDHCNGSGQCVSDGTVTCNSDSGTCGIKRECNGTSTCKVTKPGSETSCSRPDVCYIGATCNGSGSCTGGTPQCTGGDACSHQVCNGSGGCTTQPQNENNFCGTQPSCNYCSGGNCIGGCPGGYFCCTNHVSVCLTNGSPPDC